MAIGQDTALVDRRPPSVKPGRLLLFLCLLAIAAICAAATWVITQIHSSEMTGAQRELATLDLILAEETERTLQSVDLVLRDLHDRIEANHIATPDDFRRLETGEDIHTLLRGKITGIPQIEAIALIGADGTLLNSSSEYPVPVANVQGRDYFQALSAAPSTSAYLGEPIRNEGLDTWTLYLARRINARDGTFLGIVLGAIDGTYFENLYKALEIGDGGAVALWRKDGVLLARYPPATLVGAVLRSDAIAQRARTTLPYTYVTESSVGDGVPRLFSTIAGKQFPVIINVGRNIDDVLKDWRHVATLAVAAAMLCISAVIAVVWMLTRIFSAYEAVQLAVMQRGAAEAARRDAEDQLRQAQKLESIGQLTGGIAHDFNNLLTAVMGNLDLLARHAKSGDPRLERWARSALEAAKRGATLTQHLLAYSRRQPLNPKPTDIVALLNAMLDLLRRTLGENIEIQTLVADGLWQAFVDVSQLDSAILNIAINARDAMSGRGRLLIEAHNVTVDKDEAPPRFDIASGDYVMVALHDSGKGIPDDVLERVFEPFFTTKPVGQGTGLGLSQVYGFLKQTGGQIIIKSEVGHGTTVKMYLPRAKSEEPAIASGEPAVDAKSVGPAHILVVEDDPEVRAYTVETLAGLGHSVRAAANASDALDVLREDKTIGLLLTDVGLPGRNGRELVEEALRFRPDLKTLFTSGYARQAIMHDDRLDEGVELLVKPFTCEELDEKVKTVLSRDQTAA